MPISAVVISLSQDDEIRRVVLKELSCDPRLTLGDAQKNHIPAVIETDSMSEGIHMIREELPSMQGIEFVHVVSVDFSDMEPGEGEYANPRKSKSPRGVS